MIDGLHTPVNAECSESSGEFVGEPYCGAVEGNCEVRWYRGRRGG